MISYLLLIFVSLYLFSSHYRPHLRATLGPEAGMANFGGGIMCFFEQYIQIEDIEVRIIYWLTLPPDYLYLLILSFKCLLIYNIKYRKLFILGGFAAVFGSLFPTPILGVLIVFELCEPPKTYMAAMLIMFAGAIPAWLVFWAVERYVPLPIKLFCLIYIWFITLIYSLISILIFVQIHIFELLKY